MVGRGGTLLVIAHRADEAEPRPESGREAGLGHEPEPGRVSEPSRREGPGLEAVPGTGGTGRWTAVAGFTRAEVASFATGDLRAVRLTEVADGNGSARWVAEFTRP